MGSWRRAEAAVVPPALRLQLGLTAVLAALTVLALGVLYAGDSEPGPVDARIGTAAYDVGSPWRHVALALDFLGEPAGATALVVTLMAGCLLLRRPRAAALVAAGAAAAVVAATLLKSLVGRTIHGGGNLSYPSGHTAFATALALAVALTATGRLGLGRTAGTALMLGAALTAGAAMGWAQVALGAHYPTDALGGWCTALAVVPAAAWLVDRMADRAAGPMADRRTDGTTERPAGRTAGRRADPSTDRRADRMAGRTAGPPSGTGRREVR
ncbi:phosphatase PAP2 family protein [Streptomyces sp. NBC_00151]|uniref:phosphatase PAP2 family protein n=1 Tax=Streptomyces sp. NBC_00151 TaxID=2975669 RepID=UPI002DD7E224|nr:phosphatase PAP2 family protein [Streptomyces sp. NBC_00151]WRZ38695.1 phosphatase PAP2 family protein [Streptomyces sp. NBC_00151]